MFSSKVFRKSGTASLFSGSLAGLLRYLDVNLEWSFLEEYMPDKTVFNVFIVFVALVTTFRMAHALGQYMKGGELVHGLAACWHDVASTLVAFCRTSEVEAQKVDNFINTLLRLISLLSALCLEGLEQKNTEWDLGHKFEVMGYADLTHKLQLGVSESIFKVEHVFQKVHQLVVDATKDGTMNISPAILTRSFQELSHGMVIYHEAKTIACVPFPFAYRFAGHLILVSEALFMPCFLAMAARGWISAFFYTFFGTFLLWFLNGVSDSLDNPFKMGASTLEPAKVQRELNMQLRELLSQRKAPTPSMGELWEVSGKCSMGRQQSIQMLRQEFRQTIRTHSEIRLMEGANHFLASVESIRSFRSAMPQRRASLDSGARRGSLDSGWPQSVASASSAPDEPLDMCESQDLGDPCASQGSGWHGSVDLSSFGKREDAQLAGLGASEGSPPQGEGSSLGSSPRGEEGGRVGPEGGRFGCCALLCRRKDAGPADRAAAKATKPKPEPSAEACGVVLGSPSGLGPVSRGRL